MPPDSHSELEAETLGPDDDVPPNRARKHGQPQRLQRLPNHFVRVPVQWLTQTRRLQLFPPRVALFLYVLYRSRWGQRGVKLTDAVAANLGISDRRKRQIVGELERGGWVRVEREGTRTMVVWPLVASD